MRIVGGTFKGRKIVAPAGLIARPTTDRVRESIFNILSARNDFSFENAKIIDLFAGTGALGLEAMSRGGAMCLFIDTDASARAAIRNNVETLDLTGLTRIHRRSAIALGDLPASAGGPFDIAFLDAPYRENLTTPALQSLLEGHWLHAASLICLLYTSPSPRDS